MSLRIVDNPELVDLGVGRSTTINVLSGDILIHITGEGIIMDFFNEGNEDTEPDATIGMTFDEWRDLADRKAAR